MSNFRTFDYCSIGVSLEELLQLANSFLADICRDEIRRRAERDTDVLKAVSRKIEHCQSN